MFGFLKRWGKTAFAEEQDVEEAPEPTIDDLSDYITGMADIRTADRIQRDARALTAQSQSYLEGNPAANLKQVSATQSAAAGHNFIYLLNYDYYDLLDEIIRKDPTIAAALRLVTAMVLERDIQFVADEDTDQAAAIRDEIEENVTNVSSRQGWQKMVHNTLFYSLVHGFAAHEIIWEPKGPLTAPRAYIHRHPGQFAMDDFGTMYLYTADATTLAPKYKFMVLGSAAPYGNPYGQSLLDQLQYYHYFKKHALKAFAEFVDLYGTPLAKASITNPDQAQKEKILTQLKNILGSLRREAGITLPYGVDVEFIARTGGQTSSPHLTLINYLDKQSILLILGAALAMQDSEHQSRAATEVHAGIGQIRGKPLARGLSSAVTSDILTPFREINYPSSPIVRAVIDMDDAIDVDQILNAVDKALGWGVQIKEQQVREWLDLDPPGKGDKVLEKKQPPPMLPGGAPVPDPLGGGGDDFPFAEARRRSVSVVRAYNKRREDLTLAAVEENRAAVAAAISTALQPLREANTGDLWPDQPEERIKPVEADLQFEKYQIASWLLASLATMDLVEQVRDPVEFADPITDNAYSDEFREAAEWMQARGILTVSQVEALARSRVPYTNPNYAMILRQNRLNNLALAYSTNLNVTAKIREILAAAVRDGLTRTEWLEAMDNLLEAGDLTVGTDAYLSTVYRTEMGNAYGYQRDYLDNQPIVADLTWGFEFYNPDDERSNPSHARMNGVRVQSGSMAEQASHPGPPWFYNCRCDRIPLLVADPDNAEYVESEDALERVLSIRRF